MTLYLLFNRNVPMHVYSMHVYDIITLLRTYSIILLPAPLLHDINLLIVIITILMFILLMFILLLRPKQRACRQ